VIYWKNQTSYSELRHYSFHWFLWTFLLEKNESKLKRVDLEYMISNTHKNYSDWIKLMSNDDFKVITKSKMDNKQFESRNYLLQILFDACCLNRKNILKSCLYKTTKTGKGHSISKKIYELKNLNPNKSN